MTRKPRNWTYITVKTIVTLFMLGAASISFSHIIDVSQHLGLGWEAWTVPFLIDGFAVLGLIGRSHRFAESTRRAGMKITAAMGMLSLACNVMAGDNLGQRLYGVLVVGVFVFAEWYSGKLIAAPAPVVQVVSDEERARRSAAATKAAATRKANAEAKAAALADPVAAIAALPNNAPTSPAPIAAPRPPRARTVQRRTPVSPLTGRPLVVTQTP